MNIYFANYDRNGMTVVEESKYQHAVGRQLLKTALFRAGVSKDFLSKEESLIFAYGPSGKPFFTIYRMSILISVTPADWWCVR